MKKLLGILLALCMVAGIGVCGMVGISAANDPDDIEWPPSSSTEIFADVPNSANAVITSRTFRFTPSVTGKYTFSFTAHEYNPMSELIGMTTVTLFDAAGKSLKYENSIYQNTRISVKLENNLKANETYYYSVSTSGRMKSYDCTVTRTGDADWWFTLPGFVQWILRYICFGWLWMK